MNITRLLSSLCLGLLFIWATDLDAMHVAAARLSPGSLCLATAHLRPSTDNGWRRLTEPTTYCAVYWSESRQQYFAEIVVPERGFVRGVLFGYVDYWYQVFGADGSALGLLKVVHGCAVDQIRGRKLPPDAGQVRVYTCDHELACWRLLDDRIHGDYLLLCVIEADAFRRGQLDVVASLARYRRDAQHGECAVELYGNELV